MSRRTIHVALVLGLALFSQHATCQYDEDADPEEGYGGGGGGYGGDDEEAPPPPPSGETRELCECWARPEPTTTHWPADTPGSVSPRRVATFAPSSVSRRL